MVGCLGSPDLVVLMLGDQAGGPRMCCSDLHHAHIHFWSVGVVSVPRLTAAALGNLVLREGL